MRLSVPSRLSATQHQISPRGFWSDLSNQRKFFDDLGRKLNVKELDDWYSKLNSKTILDNGGFFLNAYYHNSPVKAITSVYSQHNWLPWKFEKAPNSLWNNTQNLRQFFDWLGNKLGVKHLDDWYILLDSKIVLENGGTFATKRVLADVIMFCYPEHTWYPWKFRHSRPKIQNTRSYFDWLGQELGVIQLDDWYNVLSKDAIVSHYGRPILERAASASPIQALMQAYPEHPWLPWKFKKVSHGFWKSVENQRAYFDWLGEQNGVKQWYDWYKVLSVELVKNNGGHGLLNWYNDSAVEAIMTCYPEHPWKAWEFDKCILSPKFYARKGKLSEYIADLAEKLAIQTLDDWYRVDMILLHKLGSVTLIKNFGGLFNLLKKVYPDHPWDYRRFQSSKKAQRWLVVTLRKIFPNEGRAQQDNIYLFIDIIEDYIHPKTFYTSKRPMQLDAFLPSKSWAFEYQGEQHFQDIHLFGDSSKYKQRDAEKRQLCAANNIKLIEVPYWWDRTQENLKEIIQKANQASTVESLTSTVHHKVEQ